MKKSSEMKWSSLRVGLLLVAAIAVLFWSSLSGGGTSVFQAKKQFTCYFPGVSGLLKGSPVWLAGVEVGNVRSVELVSLGADKQVAVVCRIKSSIWWLMTKDTKVQLGTIGLLGDKYVDIHPGIEGGPPIEEGSIVPTQKAIDAEAMFRAGKDAMDRTGSLVGNIDDLAARINRGEGTLGHLAVEEELYHNLTQLTANLADLTVEIQKNQGRITNSIETMSNSVEDLSEKVTQNSGTLGRIINDPALYDNLAASTARLDSIMRKIDRAEGTLGLFVNDTSLYSEFSNLLVRMNSLISDIEKNPRKYFKFSVF